MKQAIVFASSIKDDSGSTFESLAVYLEKLNIGLKIAAVVTDRDKGGVGSRARALGIPRVIFTEPFLAVRYRRLVKSLKADWVFLLGWLKPVLGLDPKMTINTHAGTWPLTAGLYGRHMHEAAMEAFGRGEITHTEVIVHFVTRKIDGGPVIFRYPVKILEDDTPQTLEKRVKQAERGWLGWVINLVVSGKIYWDGKDPLSLVVPEWYRYHKQE